MTNTPKKDHPFRNTQHVSPLLRALFALLTLTFKVVGTVSPHLAGRLALQLFMTPTRFKAPTREQPMLERATETKLEVEGRKISIKHWGDSTHPVVLLSHGWGGRASQFYAFVEPLLAEGFQVVGFDVPGHGDSEGKFTNMLDVSGVIAKVAHHVGPIDAIIGHSFGAGTSLLALDRHQIQTKKLVLISCFQDVYWIIDIFAEAFGLSKKVEEAMCKIAEQKLAHTYGAPWHWDDISPQHTITQTSAKLLLIHDTKDHETPYNHAQHLHKLVPQSTLVTTQGFGHRRILRAPECVQAVIDFL